MLHEECDRGNSQAKVSQWACCREMHKGGGMHYNCCVELSGVKIWLSVKNNIAKKYNIVLNFSDTHKHYLYAYRYVCKSDTEEESSLGHTDLSAV